MTKLFGTNGIRGVINRGMNGEFALIIGKAWGTYLKKGCIRPKIVIGTDARLSNHMLKSAVSAGLLSTGCDVVDVGLIPTPTLQYTVKEKRFDSGVVITASHNPPQFNGIKGIACDGIEFSKNVEEEIEDIYFSQHFICAEWSDVGSFSQWDGAVRLHLDGVLSNINIGLIRRKKFHVVLDCGHGAGSLVVPQLLKKLGCKVTMLFCKPDGLFPGRNSEPLPENLHILMKTVQDVNASFGVALDGDADRAIFVDERGAYIWGDKTLSLIAGYFAKLNDGGFFVTPVTTSTCFEDVIHSMGGHVFYTRVGSPVVARTMVEKKAIFGGEENGGFIFPCLQYCRDSAMTLGMMLEVLANEKKSLSDLIAELPQYHISKTKIICANEKKEDVMRTVLNQLSENREIIKIDETDGIKFYIKEGWVLMRPSGTEPLFRVYAESKDKVHAEQLAITYKKKVEQIIQHLTSP